MSFINNEKAIAYIKSFGNRKKQPFNSLFKDIRKEAVDFMDNVLQFNPKKRMSVEDAIAHPLFEKAREKLQFKEVGGKKIDGDIENLSIKDMKSRLLEYVKYYETNNLFESQLDQ